MNNNTSGMMSVRYRGESHSRSKLNETWNSIPSSNSSSSPKLSVSIPTSMTIRIQNSVLKPKSISIEKQKNHNNNLASFKSMLSISPTTSKKFSSRLKMMIHKDLHMVTDDNSSTTERTTPQSTLSAVHTKAQAHIEAGSPLLTENTSTVKESDSLCDVYSKDIEVLLRSLRSTEFVGKIDPQYHWQYVSDECFDP